MIIFSSSIIGSCLGFMKYNVYPSKVLMGDGGSYFLGISLSILTLICNQIPSFEITNVGNLYIAILLLGVPIIDMIYVIIIRICRGFSPFKPDNNHIHHRLLKNNLSHKEAVYSIYTISNFFISIVALFNFGTIGILWFIPSLYLLYKNFKKVSLDKYF